MGDEMGKKPSLMVWLFSLSVVLTACGSPTTPSAGEVTSTSPATQAVLETRPPPTATTPPATPTPAPGISLDTLLNFTYWLDDFDTMAAFQDGVFSGQSDQPQAQPLHGELIRPVAAGDLNGDGRPDAAVILTINSGGSGTFYYMVVMLNQDGAPVQAASAWIGDRQVVNTLEITDGKIILDFLTQGTNDGMCCPSEHRLRRYVFENGELDIDSDQVIE
jgi:hypothetical protein